MCRWFLVMAVILTGITLISQPVLAEEASTNKDAAGNIQFTFDDEPALKVAPSDRLCNSDSKRALRYNESTNKLELCDGSSWNQIGSAPKVSFSCTTNSASGSTATAYCPSKYYRTGGGGYCRLSSGAITSPPKFAGMHDSRPSGSSGWYIDCYAQGLSNYSVAIVNCCKPVVSY